PSTRTRGQEVASTHRINAAPDEHRGVLACARVSTHASRSRCQSRSVGLGSRSASTSPSAAQTWHGWLAGGVLPPGPHEARTLTYLGAESRTRLRQTFSSVAKSDVRWGSRETSR